MKIVKERINEKFSEESDPIHDMGIGIYPPGTIVKKIYKSAWKDGVSSKFWEIEEFTSERDDVKGIVLKRELGDKVHLWIAFFGQESRIYDEILPNIHKGLDFFTDEGYSIQHGELPINVWLKNIKILKY